MEKKLYNTPGRARLAAYLRDTATLPPQSAEEIYLGLCATGEQAPGRSSVYRMLGTLCERGEVKRFSAENGFAYQYVGARDCGGHFHLQCTACGGVTHLECDCGNGIAQLLGAHGFVVDRGRSVLYGLCKLCRDGGRGE